MTVYPLLKAFDGGGVEGLAAGQLFAPQDGANSRVIRAMFVLRQGFPPVLRWKRTSGAASGGVFCSEAVRNR